MRFTFYAALAAAASATYTEEQADYYGNYLNAQIADGFYTQEEGEVLAQAFAEEWDNELAELEAAAQADSQSIIRNAKFLRDKALDGVKFVGKKIGQSAIGRGVKAVGRDIGKVFKPKNTQNLLFPLALQLLQVKRIENYPGSCKSKKQHQNEPTWSCFNRATLPALHVIFCSSKLAFHKSSNRKSRF